MTNQKSSTMQMQKSMRDRVVAHNQPSQINQVFTTGIALDDEQGKTNPNNPFMAVQRLYERHEQNQVKQAILEEQLFNQKHSFHPTTYSERPTDSATTYFGSPSRILANPNYTNRSIAMGMTIPFDEDEDEEEDDFGHGEFAGSSSATQLRLTSAQLLNALQSQK